MDSPWKPKQQLPTLARALEERYPGIEVSVEIEQFKDEEPFRRIIFKGRRPELRRYGLLPSAEKTCIDEHGSKIVPIPEGVYHFHKIHGGAERGLWSRAQHPDNATTRRTVSLILARLKHNSLSKAAAIR